MMASRLLRDVSWQDFFVFWTFVKASDAHHDPVRAANILDQFPLDSNAMVSGLDSERIDLLWRYVAHTAHSEAVADILIEVSRRYPKHLRVKELFETMESCARIGQAIYDAYRGGRVRTIYDLACGHGLLGILFAWRFRDAEVVGVDRERQDAFGHYLDVARSLGHRIDNIRVVEADIADTKIEHQSYVVCIHACNEATQMALDKAGRVDAPFSAMPCCIRDGIYFKRMSHLDEQSRYTAAVSVIAGLYGADKVTAIDARITNRNLIAMRETRLERLSAYRPVYCLSVTGTHRVPASRTTPVADHPTLLVSQCLHRNLPRRPYGLYGDRQRYEDECDRPSDHEGGQGDVDPIRERIQPIRTEVVGDRAGHAERCQDEDHEFARKEIDDVIGIRAKRLAYAHLFASATRTVSDESQRTETTDDNRKNREEGYDLTEDHF